MSKEGEHNLETRPANEAGEDRSLEAPAAGEEHLQGVDPLDEITDPELLRNEAKKQRGIAARLAKKPEEAAAPVAPAATETAPVAPVAPAPVAGEYLSRKDFERSNEKKAIKLATTVADSDDEETRIIRQELDENWDRVKIHYSGRRGKDTPEDILEDLLDAHAVWKRNEGGKKPADPQGDAARAHAASPVARQGSARPASAAAATDTSTDPRFSTAPSPKTWYKEPGT